MIMRVEVSAGVTVVAFSGRLDTLTAPAAQGEFDRLLAGGASRLVADFSALEFLTSAGLRVLLMTSKRAREAGGGFGVCSVNEAVQEVLDISGFSSILHLFPHRREAIESL